MKNKKRIIGVVYYLLLAGLVLHVVAVSQLMNITLGFTSGNINKLVLFGDVRLKLDSTLYKSVALQPLDSSKSIQCSVRKNHKVSSVISYRNLNEVSSDGWVLFSLDFLKELLWLTFTFQLFNIVKSLKKGDVFELKNIQRLRWIAMVVGLSPVVDFFSNRLFCNLLNQSIAEPTFRYVHAYRLVNFQGIFYMMLILLIIEIFRVGLAIKSEQDLTI